MSIAQISFQAIAFKVSTIGNPIKSQFKPADFVSEITFEPQATTETITASIAEDFRLLSADSENDGLISAFKRRIQNDADIIKPYGVYSIILNQGLYSLAHHGFRDAQNSFKRQRHTGFVCL